MPSSIFANIPFAATAMAALPTVSEIVWASDLTRLIVADWLSGDANKLESKTTVSAAAANFFAVPTTIPAKIAPAPAPTATIIAPAAAAKPRVPRCHLAVSYDAPTPAGTNLPAAIEKTWRSEFSRIVWDDLRFHRFGVQRHVSPFGFTIMYRLIASDESLSRSARDITTPFVNDLLSGAKVWLSFDEELPAEAPVAVAVVESISEPVSPALSEVTMVGEPEESFANAKFKAILEVSADLTATKSKLFNHFFDSGASASPRFPLAAAASPSSIHPIAAASPATSSPRVAPKSAKLYTHFFGATHPASIGSKRLISRFPVNTNPASPPTSYSRIFTPQVPRGRTLQRGTMSRFTKSYAAVAAEGVVV